MQKTQKLKVRCLDKRPRHDVITKEEVRRRDGTSEDEWDIQYRSASTNPTSPPEIDTNDSENFPLINTSPRKITPSELHFYIGDNNTKLVYNEKNVACKTIMRKAKEPRAMLASQ